MGDIGNLGKSSPPIYASDKIYVLLRGPIPHLSTNTGILLLDTQLADQMCQTHRVRIQGRNLLTVLKETCIP